VVGDNIADGSPLEVAEELARENGAPVLVVTAHRFMLQHRVPDGATVDGPYHLTQLDDVLASIAGE
jgi:hypothetical protein